MKFVIGLAVLALAALSQATKSPDNDFDLKKLVKAIGKCTPKYVVQSCKCGPNVILWNDCIHKYLNLSNGPKIDSCVTLTQVEKMCTLYGKNKKQCYKIDKDGKPVESVIKEKDCNKDVKPIKFVSKHKVKEVVDDKTLSTHHSEKEIEDLNKLSFGDNEEDIGFDSS